MPDPDPARPGWVPSLPRPRALEGRAAAAAAVAGGVLLALAAWWAWSSRAVPAAVPVVVAAGTPVAAASSAAGPAPTGPSAGSAPGSSAAGEVVVEVVGRVRRPGVVRLRGSARVADAVAAAGGLARGTHDAGVNLARRLVDGEQVVVGPAAVCSADGSGGSGAASGSSPAAGAPGTDAVVDLNAATLADLDTLPGVGPVLAQRILDWRTAHGGRFSSVDELREVAGIGERTFAELAPRVRV